MVSTTRRSEVAQLCRKRFRTQRAWTNSGEPEASRDCVIQVATVCQPLPPCGEHDTLAKNVSMVPMNGDDPEFVEATRFAIAFFPEARGFISTSTGMDWDSFLGAMMTADFHADYSCYPCRAETDPDLGLADRGGLDGNDDDIYIRLLNHTDIVPRGRAVVVLDAIGRTGWSMEDCRPFVCHSRTVPERLKEITCFGQSRDIIFIFESGSAILIDHDDRVHWACSRIRNWNDQSNTKTKAN